MVGLLPLGGVPLPWAWAGAGLRGGELPRPDGHHSRWAAAATRAGVADRHQGVAQPVPVAVGLTLAGAERIATLVGVGDVVRRRLAAGRAEGAPLGVMAGGVGVGLRQRRLGRQRPPAGRADQRGRTSNSTTIGTRSLTAPRSR